jgi:oligopeptide/dipeptide ABC transporter ATP-binding protein
VLQDPYDSLDPRMRLRDIVAEPLRIHHLARRDAGRRAGELLAAVGLPDAPLDSYPARYSGGGRQRIAIARALICDPAVLICDEPTSSLDVSMQAQIVNLLLDAKRSRGLSMLFVSHDLDLIGRIADRLVVLYRGRMVESGPAALVRAQPRHPYTKSLHDAIPADHPERRRALAASSGAASEPAATASARPAADSCVFASRCPRATARCRTERPPLVTEPDGRSHACFFPLPAGGSA